MKKINMKLTLIGLNELRIRAISFNIGLEWCILNNVNFSKEQTCTCEIITFIDFTIIARFSNAF